MFAERLAFLRRVALLLAALVLLRAVTGCAPIEEPRKENPQVVG